MWVAASTRHGAEDIALGSDSIGESLSPIAMCNSDFDLPADAGGILTERLEVMM